MSWCHYQPITLQGIASDILAIQNNIPVDITNIHWGHQEQCHKPSLPNKCIVLQPRFECIFCISIHFWKKPCKLHLSSYFISTRMAIKNPWEWKSRLVNGSFFHFLLLLIQTVELADVASRRGSEVVLHYPHKLQCHSHGQRHLVLPLWPPYGMW